LGGGGCLTFRVVKEVGTPLHPVDQTGGDPPPGLPIVRGSRPYSEIRFPECVSPDQADQVPFPDEPVLGLVVNGQARAYSTNQLNDHEMVIDEVGGVPVLVTYCPLCRTGIVYDRRVNGEVLDFRHRGWLYEESFVFADTRTGSLWVQATGKAVYGAYRGTRLERLPVTHTTWARWREQHPETLVMGRPAGLASLYREDRYDSYYATGDGVRYHRRGPLGLGLAVLLPDRQRFYPFRQLANTPALADRLGDEPVLVVYHAASHTGVAFERRHAGRELDFRAPVVKDNDVILIDRQTGSTWSGLTGRCLDGPAKGAQLRQLVTTQFVEENWPLHYPGEPNYPGL
jgi:hypothetical protein